MTSPNDYNRQDLLLAKHIAELLIDRCVDIKILKAINETIFLKQQINNKH